MFLGSKMRRFSGMSVVELIVAVGIAAVVISLSLQFYLNTSRQASLSTRKSHASEELLMFNASVQKHFSEHRSTKRTGNRPNGTPHTVMNPIRQLSTVAVYKDPHFLVQTNGIEKKPNPSMQELRYLTIEKELLTSTGTLEITRLEYSLQCVPINYPRNKNYSLDWNRLMTQTECLPVNSPKPLCNWSTQTVAIRLDTFNNWLDVNDINNTNLRANSTKCFPAHYTPDKNGRCTAPQFSTTYPVGMAFCAWSNEYINIMKGDQISLRTFAFYVGGKENLDIIEKDNSFVRLSNNLNLELITQ